MSRTFTAGVLCALAIVVVAGCSSKSPAGASGAPRLITTLDGSVDANGILAVRVPDAQDGQTGSNPPGTIEIFSYDPAGLQVDSTMPRSKCPYDPTLWVTVTMENYATEALNNVALAFNDINPVINQPCNNWPSSGSPDYVGAYPGEVNKAFSLISYGNLTGSIVSDGSAPGGSNNRMWMFAWGSQAPFTFKAKIWATVFPAPPIDPSPTAGTTLLTAAAPTLTWRSWEASAGHVDIATDPTFAALSIVASADVTSPGGPPYTFTYVAPVPTAGTVYYWRAVNRFTGSGGSTVNGTFSTGGSYQVGPVIKGPGDGYYGIAAPNTQYLEATIPSGWTQAVFTVCAGNPPCTTTIANSGVRPAMLDPQNGSSIVDWHTPTLAAGKYTWRVASGDSNQGYAERTFYMESPPTNLHSHYEFAYKHRFYADSYAPWVDFYWYGDVNELCSGTPCTSPYISPATAWRDPTRTVPPPGGLTFTSVDYPGVHHLFWRACNQYGGGVTYDTTGIVGTQGACSDWVEYTDTLH
jgi:hypothetical protein